MAERMRRVITNEIVDYPIRINHVDGSWTLAPTDDRRRRGGTEWCSDPICPICHDCSFCLKRPPVALTDDLYTICDECGVPESNDSGTAPSSGDAHDTRHDGSLGR